MNYSEIAKLQTHDKRVLAHILENLNSLCINAETIFPLLGWAYIHDIQERAIVYRIE